MFLSEKSNYSLIIFLLSSKPIFIIKPTSKSQIPVKVVASKIPAGPNNKGKVQTDMETASWILDRMVAGTEGNLYSQ